MASNSYARPGSDTEANVHTAKHAKVRNWVPKSGKQCTKVLQKIRQEGNCTYNNKNQVNKHTNQQKNAHTTRDNTPQNAVIYTSAKSAPIITQFFVQKQMQNHRTKSKLEKKIFSEKAMPETAQACTEKRIIEVCKPRANLANGSWHPKNQKKKLIAKFLK